MQKKFLSSAVAVAFICAGFIFNYGAALGASNGVNLHTSTADGVAFTLTTPLASIENQTIMIDGISEALFQPGAPQIPFQTVLVALPPMADASISVTASDVTTQAVTEVAPAPTIVEQVERIEELQITGLEELDSEQIRDDAIYASDALFPSNWYEISDPIQSRDLRYVVVKLFPARLNAAANTLTQATSLNITVDFENAAQVGEPLLLDAQQALAKTMLNGADAALWGYMPREGGTRTSGVALPLGQTAIKIEIDKNGIYELSRSDLQAAGLNVAAINPNTIEMMHRGESVSYQFIGDTDGSFESNEKVRFYGWDFDGTSEEHLYVKNNVFWLWSNGSASTINSIANSGTYPQVLSYRATVTVAPQESWTPTYTPHWDSFEAEPDMWYWDRLEKTTTGFVPVSHPMMVELTSPRPSGTDATFKVEYLTGFASEQNVSIDVNGERRHSNEINLDSEAVIIDGTIAQANLINGDNQFDIVMESYSKSDLWFNSITVEYWRSFASVDNYIEFELADAGQQQIVATGFTSSTPAITWNVTDRHNPVAINIGTSDRSGTGPYNYRMKSNRAESSIYAMSDATNMLSPLSMSSYTAQDIDPASGAVWVAITHADFVVQANDLAAHRQSYSELSTHVVDVEAILNQVGYGLPLPEAIRDYMKSAMSNWSTKPQYLVLLGDTTQNTHDLPCIDAPWCGTTWLTGETVFVPTYMLFEDRKIGVAPSDHPFAMLVGDDLTPDISVGRLSGSTSAEMTIMVDKIKLYENNLLNPQPYMNNIAFMSDNTDGGGNFCVANAAAAQELAPSLNVREHCIETASAADEAAAHNVLLDMVNNQGLAIMNYRGHGGINAWGTSGLLNIAKIDSFTNADRPFITLSADCLDSHFAWVNRPGIAETMLGYAGGGSAAHWGSTGLGYTFEHTILHASFVDAMFDQGLTRIGDAINASKAVYVANDQDISEIYAFTLHGDPAMQMMRTDLEVGLSLEATSRADVVEVNASTTNANIYPTQSQIVIDIPSNATIVDVQFSAAAHQTFSNGKLIIDFDEAIGYDEVVSAVVELSVPGYGPSNPVIVRAEANPETGSDHDMPDNNAAVALPNVPLAAGLSSASAQQTNTLAPIALMAAAILGMSLIQVKRRK